MSPSPITSFTTQVTSLDVLAHLNDPTWKFVDCRFELGKPESGEASYLEAHIPGALYAHLDRGLSGPVVPGKTGRHPLPDKPVLKKTLTQLGIGHAAQVVVYDHANGQMAAARLWWLLKWAGHEAVAVLDGGFRAWRQQNLPLESGRNPGQPQPFKTEFNDHLILTAEDVVSSLRNSTYSLLDSRTAERFRGENENVDPVAGHIPGACSAPFIDVINADGLLKTPTELREHFRVLSGGRDSGHLVFYCGSGVTAALNILAFAYAGLGMAKLYAGSWSDWINDPSRPVERSCANSSLREGGKNDSHVAHK